MGSTSGWEFFKGTIFFVWKGNRPCRIYVSDRQVYFIRRVADLVRDDDPTPPDQLISEHADNFAIPVADIVDPSIEAAGKYTSYGKNAGRWHFTRRGDAKETVVLFESPDEARRAVMLLGGVFGSRLRNDSGIVAAESPDRAFTWRPSVRETADGRGLVTDLPVPPEQVAIVEAIRGVTKLLNEQAPAGWQKIQCEVRPAPPGRARPLEVVAAYSAQPADRRSVEDPEVYQAAMRLARTLSSSLDAFPGVVIEMTRLEQGGWHNRVQLMNKR